MSFRLGLIADIHADLEGLHKALALLDRLEADRIICSGDLVERGYDGDAVIDLIRSRSISSIKGNHEYIILHKHRSMQETGKPDGLGYREMRPDCMEFIKALPDNLRLEIEGVRLIMGHGTPWDDFTAVLPDSRPGLFQKIAQKSEADVVVLGHTHQPLYAQIGPVLILNPGSIYSVGSRTCAMLTLPQKEFTVYQVDTGDLITNVPTVLLTT
jgi:putative phosphoesterase